MYLGVYVLIGFIYSIKGTTFKVTNEQNVWNLQFDCGTGYEMAGNNAFSNCQPETCKQIPLNIDKRIKINDTYWINGYALMSPIIEYLGCFEMKPTDIATNLTSIPDNDVLMCSLFCKKRGFNTNTVILLKTKWSDSSMNGNLNLRCSKQCPGDETDQCGGSNYFSVYNITENKIKGRELSCVCENLQNLAHSIEECQICPVDLAFLCHNSSSGREDGKQIGTNCSQIPLTWRQELGTCLKSGASFKILTRSSESCYIDPVAVNISDFRYSFVKLSFVWNTRPKSKYDYKCLGLRLEKKKNFKLLPINCTEKRKALCHKVSEEDSTEDLNGLWTQHTTLQSTPYTTVFYVSEVNHTWDRTVDNCIDGWTLSGEKMFNSCRSESCQTINANKILPNVKKKPRFLWVDGYVVRSPVMEYYECLDFTALQSTLNALENIKTLNHNGVEECSLFCKEDEYLNDKDFILLQNDTCYCVRYTTLAQWDTQGKKQRVSTKSCNTRCDGDKFDRCGGRKTLFSAYKLIGLPISDEIGGNCFFTVGTGSNRNRNRISCKERLSFKCEAVMTSDGKRDIDVKCDANERNWYDARKTCNIFKKYIQLLNNKCDNNQEIADKIWHNRFVKERIVWNTDIPTDRYKTNGYSCLAMKLTEDSNYILSAQDCDKEYHSLCQKDVWNTNGITTNNEQETGHSKDGSRIIDVKCSESKMNWYDARKTCNIYQKYIQLLNNKCDNNRKIVDTIWHNRFVKERIVWNAKFPTDRYKTNGYSCLAIKLTEDSNYMLTAQKCDKEYHSLCQKKVWDTNGITTNNEQETGDTKGSMVSIYVGIAVALTLLLIIVIVFVVYIRRRKRYKPEDASAATDVYYSTVTGDQIHDNQSHTMDGANADQYDANLMVSAKIINQYTDNDEQEINQQGAMYDQAGVPDSNEYDVSSTFRKYSLTPEEDVGYYDHNRDADTMYDATDTKGLIQRNEMSQIYDHTREINDDYDISHAYRQHDKTINESVYSQSDF